MAHRRSRRAPLRFRRPLRLPVADRGRLCRQHHDDPRSRRSGPSGRGRAVVDPGAVEGRRRALSLGQLGLAALPSSAAHGRSPLCQLLASRAVHSRHLRHVAAEGGGARQYQPGLSASDAHLSADPATAQGAPHHGGGGRGRRQAAAVGPLLHLDLRHHGRAIAGADRNLPGARARPRRQPAAADERLPPAIGALRAAPSSRSPGSRRGCAWSTSPTRSRPARSAIFCPIRPRARIACPPTTSRSTIAA